MMTPTSETAGGEQNNKDDSNTNFKGRTTEEIMDQLRRWSEEDDKLWEEKLKKKRDDWRQTYAHSNPILTYLDSSSTFLSMAEPLNNFIDDVALSIAFKTKEFIEEDISLLKKLASKVAEEYDKLMTASEGHERIYIETFKELVEMHQVSGYTCRLGDVDMLRGAKHWTPPSDEAELNIFLSYIKDRDNVLKEKEGKKINQLKDQKGKYKPLDPKFMHDREYMENCCKRLNRIRETAVLERQKILRDILAFDEFRYALRNIIKRFEETVSRVDFKQLIAEAFKRQPSTVEKTGSSEDEDEDEDEDENVD